MLLEDGYMAKINYYYYSPFWWRASGWEISCKIFTDCRTAWAAASLMPCSSCDVGCKADLLAVSYISTQCPHCVMYSAWCSFGFRAILVSDVWPLADRCKPIIYISCNDVICWCGHRLENTLIARNILNIDILCPLTVPPLVSWHTQVCQS